MIFKKLRNINSVDVALKQWLYNRGDQCEWNTGSWMICLANNIARNVGTAATAKTTRTLTFSNDKISMFGSISATPYYLGRQEYSRAGGLVDVNIGTSKPLPISIQKYSSMKLSGSNLNINYNIRVGNANDENTATSTPTILQAGSGDSAELALGDYNPYIVIGKTLDYPSNKSSDYLNVSFSAEIEEIYLV